MEPCIAPIPVIPSLDLRDPGGKGGTIYPDECIPAFIITGMSYPFIERGQRVHPISTNIPLRLVSSTGKVTLPLAIVTIIEETHLTRNGESWTKGWFKVAGIASDDGGEIIPVPGKHVIVTCTSCGGNDNGGEGKGPGCPRCNDTGRLLERID